MLYAIVALLVIIADQWVKYWVSMSISMASTGEPLIPGILSLVNLHNDGCAFSLLSGGGARIYFIILTGIFTVAVIIALATRFISGPVSRWSIVLVTAGGLSNCIDRVIYGYVQDMFKLELFNFPVFNVADIFITICCIVFVLAIIFEKNPTDDYDDEFEEDDDEEEDRPKLKSKKEKAAIEGEAPAKPLKGKKKAQDQYEQYKAERAARPAPAPQPQRRPKQTPDGSDPFAEWEKASAKVEAQQKNTYAARATGVAPSNYTRPQARYSAPAQPAARPAAPRPARPVPPAAPQAPQSVRPQMPVEQPVQQPAPQPAVQERPQTKPASADNGLDFSLDDILNEFK